jgi:catechol 2,3-dioxygenase-like lactoylglutathione lyase family enzyme
MDHTANVTSAVIVVSELDRSLAFYRDVFACEVSIHDGDGALLLAPGGFEIYLIAKSARAEHLTGGIGHEFLIWGTDTPEGLDQFERALKDHGRHIYTHTIGGVRFVEGGDPDGIRVIIAHPSPGQHPRWLLDPRLYT